MSVKRTSEGYVMTRETRDGELYINFYMNQHKELTITENGTVKTIPVKPAIVVRYNNKTYGTQLIEQFIYNGNPYNEYKSKSHKFEKTEIYYKLSEWLKFISWVATQINKLSNEGYNGGYTSG